MNNNGPHFFFDLDGTLCEPGKAISDSTLYTLGLFKHLFNAKVYIVTASNFETVFEKHDLLHYNEDYEFYTIDGIFTGLASRLHSMVDGQLVEDEETTDAEAIKWEGLVDELSSIAADSGFTEKTEPHMVMHSLGRYASFSVLGKAYTPEQRAAYIEYDKENHEREKIVKRLRESYPNHIFYVGGETGIDIAMNGTQKNHAFHCIEPDMNISYYFGDGFGLYGNDEDMEYAFHSYNIFKCRDHAQALGYMNEFIRNRKLAIV